MVSLPRFHARHWRSPDPAAFALMAVGVLVLQAVALIAMGHSMICACGTLELWYPANAGPGTSQHLTDWYTFTHLVHGFLFYLLLWMAVPGAPFRVLFVMGLGLEGVWEIVENMPFIVERYRETALAAGYFGDSVVNSISDSLAMGLGFVLARWLPVWSSIAVVVGLEAGLAAVVRDNLTLNVVQLVYPIEAISRWQAGG